MYIHAKYMYISLTAMLPLKFGEDNGGTIVRLLNKISPSLAGQNNKFSFAKQKMFVLKSIVLKENLIVNDSRSLCFSDAKQRKCYCV